MTQRAQILILAPFPQLAAAIRAVIREQFGGLEDTFLVVEANLSAAQKFVQREMPASIRVLVSRGGTSEMLKHMALPVIDIQTSGWDILRAIQRFDHTRTNNRIGVTGFGNIVYGCEEIEKFSLRRLMAIRLANEAEVHGKVMQAYQNGMGCLVGDAVSVHVAQELGIPAQIIESGRDAISQAISEAVFLHSVIQRAESKSEALAAVIQHAPDAILTTRGQKITLWNHKAEELFSHSQDEALGRQLVEMAKPLTRLPQRNTEAELSVDIKGKSYVVQRTYLEKTLSGLTSYTLRSKEKERIPQIKPWEAKKESNQESTHTKGMVAKYHFEQIIGHSAACMAMKHKAEKYAQTDSTILLTGASGTGKELLAQSIHHCSLRRNGPFVAVNCAAFNEQLLESELFGYKEGAFTGAKRGGKRGVFELANGGTLFLDEIGEMPLAMQPRLLRVLQEREVMPLGSETIIPLNVRIIAATNKNLLQMVNEDRFRQDLYYRLNILRLRMPSLQERREDIPDLVRFFMQRVEPDGEHLLTEEATKFLMSLAWPGNIRQLANVTERMLLLADREEIDLRTAQFAFADEDEDARDEDTAESAHAEIHETLPPAKTVLTTPNLHVLEEDTMRRVLAEEGGNMARAAKRLGIHRSTLWRKLKQATK